MRDIPIGHEQGNLPGRIQPLCDFWDDGHVTLPLQSRLYHLEPIGVGTSLAESLTSYIKRLAEAHSVYPRALVTDEIAPLLRQSHIYQQGRLVYNYLTNFWKASHLLNGTRATAGDWVQALEQLTLRNDLSWLTLLCWSEVLPAMRLLRRTRAWCPACYEEWRKANQIAYEPLLWSLKVVKVCCRHHIQLQQRCPSPSCRQAQLPLAPRSMPGYCTKCNRWLGSEAQEEAETAPQSADEEWQLQQWVSYSVGELLAASPGLSPPPSRETLLSNMAAYLERIVNKRAPVVAQTQIYPTSLWQWKKGRHIPELESLLRLCYHFGITPLTLFTEAIVRPAEQAPSERFILEKPRRKPRAFDADELKRSLAGVLQCEEAPPPSVAEIARRLDYDFATLWRRFPEECRAISKRYQAYQVARKLERIKRRRDEVIRAIQTIHASGQYPSDNSVKKLLKQPGIFRDPEVVKLWRETVRALGWEQ
jgi:TniQ